MQLPAPNTRILPEEVQEMCSGGVPAKLEEEKEAVVPPLSRKNVQAIEEAPHRSRSMAGQ